MSNFPFLFGTPWPWWLIALAGAGAGYLTWRGYRRRMLEAAWPRLLLPALLRICGGTLLFLCLLQPMHRERVKENKASRLTLLIDDSESMAFTDSKGGPSRQARVKAALLGDAAAREAVKPNTEIRPDPHAMLGVLADGFQVQLESFSTASRVLAQGDSGCLAAAMVRDLHAGGGSTDIAKALGESLARLKGPDGGGLVLVSDGADTVRGGLERVLALYKRAGLPVCTLGIGAAHAQDLAVTQVRCRRMVSKDTLIRAEVDVRRTGFDGSGSTRHTVCIKRNGQTACAPVQLELKGETGTAVFEFLPDGQGFLEYEAAVEPFPGEWVTANNTLSFGVAAYSRKLRVLYMEGSMYQHRYYPAPALYGSHPMMSWWEHQFLERALSEDLDAEVDVLAKEPFAAARSAPALNLRTVKEGGYPKTKKDLYQYDVIVCGDIPCRYFTGEQIQWTVDFVAKHGGGFVMIGGWDSFGEGKYAKTAVDRMLPVEMNANDDHAEGISFRWKITSEGWQHPIMQLEKDEEANRAAWNRLPQFYGFSKTTRLKPAATCLASVADEEYETAYGPAILLAVQPFGNGRSMAFTTDSTGGWGAEWEDTWGPAGAEDLTDRNKYFKTFWKNAVRWLAHYRMQAPNQLVQLESSRLVYGRGENPEIRVKVMNEDCELTHDAAVSLNVTGPGGQTQTLSVFPRYDEPGIYERRLELPAAGRYEIEAVAALKKDELGRDKCLLQVRPATEELRDLSQNAALLKQIAAQTGGIYLPIEQAGELPRHLREAAHVIERHRDNDLWDSPWVFALIIGLLCGEWFLRKRSGLP